MLQLSYDSLTSRLGGGRSTRSRYHSWSYQFRPERSATAIKRSTGNTPYLGRFDIQLRLETHISYGTGSAKTMNNADVLLTLCWLDVWSSNRVWAIYN